LVRHDFYGDKISKCHPRRWRPKVAALETEVEGLKSILQAMQIKVEENQERLIPMINKNKEESNGKGTMLRLLGDGAVNEEAGVADV